MASEELSVVVRKAPWRGGRLPREQVDQRIDRLLDIALEEFAASGFVGTSLDRLVDRSGVSKTTMFRKFGNKEGLFRTLVDQIVVMIRARLDAVMLDPADPEGTITRLVAAYSDIAIERPEGHMLLSIAIAEKKAVPLLGEMLIAYSDQGLEPIIGYIGALMSKGVLAPADPREVAFDLQALMSHGFRVMVDDPAFLHRPGRHAEIARRFIKGWS